MQFVMKIDGLDALARKLQQMPEAVGKRTMAVALKKAAEPIRGMAAANMKRGPTAPHAADNVKIQVGRSGFSVAIGPTKDHYYWKFQELGTARHPAQPAMRPAFDSRSPESLQIVSRELWNALEGAAEQETSGIGGRFL